MPFCNHGHGFFFGNGRKWRKRNAKCRVKADRKVCFGLTMKIGKGKPIGMMDPRGQGQYHVIVPVVTVDFFSFSSLTNLIDFGGFNWIWAIVVDSTPSH